MLSDEKVGMTMDGESHEFPYEVDGNDITIRGVEGRELTMKRRADSLEGGPEMPMIFKKQ